MGKMEELRRAAELLPPGASVTLTREQLLDAFGPADQAAHVEAPDRLLTAREVARRLGVSPKWVYSHHAELAFSRRLGKKALRFSERGLDRHLARPR